MKTISLKSWKTNFYKKALTSVWIAGLLFLLLSNAACTPSGSPSSEELIKTAVPTFSGQTYIAFTTTSLIYNLSGECDPKSYGLEISNDGGSTWTDIDGGCNNGAFNLDVTVPGVRTFHVRAKTKKGHTGSSRAFVRFILPPTDPAFQVVNAGSSADEGGLGAQFTMSGTFAGTPEENGQVHLDYHITGIVYGDKVQ